MEMIWPKCFDDGVNDATEYRPDDDEETRLSLALADQLSAWGICMSGTKPIETFGHTMAMLSGITGAATASECMAMSKQRHP